MLKRLTGRPEVPAKTLPTGARFRALYLVDRGRSIEELSTQERGLPVGERQAPQRFRRSRLHSGIVVPSIAGVEASSCPIDQSLARRVA